MQSKLAAGCFLVSAILFCGCSLTQEFSRTPRTAVEQLLLTAAIEHALHDLTISLPEQTSLRVDVTGLQTDRAHFNMVGDEPGCSARTIARSPLNSRFHCHGSRAIGLPDRPARHRARVPGAGGRRIVRNDAGAHILRHAACESVLIPFSLPALVLYSAEGQKGYARLHVDFFEYQSGKLVGSSPTIIGRTYYNQYTLLFFFTWQTTDLSAPP